MFLKTLVIQRDQEIIREITFRKGINLIVDETSSELKISTGNGVGKTTVLRLIDFCLDGSGNNVYIDPEFKSSNTVVESFLKSNNIIISLTLKADLDDDLSEEILIEKNFLLRKDKVQRINGETLKNDEFSKKLNSIIFKNESPVPTFKQLKSKNIRDEKNKLVNTIKVLPPNVVTDVTYESLHLFWFGIDVNLSKDKLVRDRSLEKRIQTRLRKENNLSQINQSLLIIEKRIDELGQKKDSFNVNENYESDFASLNEVRRSINTLTSEISRLELRSELIKESRRDLEKSTSNVDVEQIAHLYNRAKMLIPTLQKTFEETLDFHNGMIQKRITFIAQELPELEKELRVKQHILSDLLIRENHFSERLKKSGAVEELQAIINELNEFYEKKGKLEEQKRSWEFSMQNIASIEAELQDINSALFSKDELIQKRIAHFNTFFSDISSRLDGVHSLLSADNPDGVYKFVIGNIEGNPGTGSKKSQMASFDLAYIKFADSIDLPCLHFVLQDQIENVHSNQITNLLTSIVSEVNCQYVLPVLRDKLPSNINVSAFEVLSLSQKEKLFKL